MSRAADPVVDAASLRPRIGLEVHARLDTRTKLFCACPNEPLATPNAATCPVCAGLPGALPTLNRAAVEQALRIALRLGCTVADVLAFDRKHYAYPDLPKGYQITQQRKPLGKGGALALDDAASEQGIALRGLHIEEDAGRSRHDAANTLVDLGRAGAPLVELVTEPVLTSAREVARFLERLRDELRFVGAAKCDMERGDLRVDVNVSLEGARAGGAGIASPGIEQRSPRIELRSPRIELKNLNSISAAFDAVRFETRRLKRALAEGRGGELVAETRGWNPEQRRSYPLRPKEHATDYRWLPEPDLAEVRLDPAVLAALGAELPPRPAEHRARLARIHDLRPSHVAAMTRSPARLARFEALVAAGVEAKRVAKWLTNNQRRLRRELLSAGHEPVALTDERLAKLLAAWQAGRLSREGTEAVARELFTGDARAPRTVAEELGLWRPEAAGALDLAALIEAALAAEPGAAADWRAGKAAALQRLVGHVMRAASGHADGAAVRRAFEARR